jgi:hypothetical protein
MPGPFEYTQGSFWGGPWYPYWTLMVITVLGGLFGLDHFWLRSPTTGLAKLVLNLLTFGMWWIYDILQVFGEKDKVKKYGLSIPIYGAAGIGSGVFRDGLPEGTQLAKSPFRYILYMMAIWLPLGLDMVIQGDLNGGVMKFASLIIIFLWPIAAIWYILTLGKAYFAPKTLFTQGTGRFFPWTWVAAAEGPNKLAPKDIDPTGGTSSGGFFGALRYGIQSVIGVLAPPLLPAEAAVGAAVQATAGAVTAGAKTVQTAAETATEVLEAVAGAAGSGLNSLGGVPSQVMGPLSAKVSPEALQSLAGAASGAPGAPSQILGALSPQKGGGLTIIPDTNSPIVNTILTVLFAGVAIGGSVAAFKRLNPGGITDTSNGRQRDDTPPKPRSI